MKAIDTVEYIIPFMVGALVPVLIVSTPLNPIIAAILVIGLYVVGIIDGLLMVVLAQKRND